MAQRIGLKNFSLPFLLFLSTFTRLIDEKYFAYFLAIVLLEFLLRMRRTVTFNGSLVLLALWAVFTLIQNDLNLLYWNKFVKFLAMILMTGAVIGVGPSYSSRLMNSVRIGAILFTVVGFIDYLLGNGLGRGGYSGIFEHTMQAAPVAALSYLFLRDMRCNSFMFFSLSLISIVSVFLAASKSVLIYVIIIGFIDYWRFLLPLGILLGDYLFKSLSSSSLDRLLFVLQKGDVLMTREGKFDVLVADFMTKPFFGNGFYYISEQLLSLNKLMIEPGSSILFLLSTLGLVGFILFIIYILKALKTVSIIILCFFIWHMFWEGYLFSSGSIMSWFFWSIMSSKKA